MPQLIQPHLVKVVSKEGECEVHITLDLNINLNTGELAVLGRPGTTTAEKKKEEEEEVAIIVPTFTPTANKDKVKFGKKG